MRDNSVDIAKRAGYSFCYRGHCAFETPAGFSLIFVFPYSPLLFSISGFYPFISFRKTDLRAICRKTWFRSLLVPYFIYNIIFWICYTYLLGFIGILKYSWRLFRFVELSQPCS